MAKDRILSEAIRLGRYDVFRLLHPSDLNYSAARHYHAWHLRFVDGLTFREIAPRLGVSAVRARDMYKRHVEDLCRATRRTHFRWLP